MRVGGCSTDVLAEAYSSWLGQEPFSLLLTVTSAKITHPEAMLKRVRFIVRTMNASYFGKRWRSKQRTVQSVVAIERHKSGNPHAHALLRFPDGLPRCFDRTWWQEFATKSGGWCKLEIPRSQDDVIAYCCKYVVKGGDIYLSENFEAVQSQRLLFDSRKARKQAAQFRVAKDRDEQSRLDAMLADEG